MKLIHYKEKFISRGSVFRLPAIWPYEKWVDFMVFETQDDERPYGLIVSSGYKAGLFLIKLPIESISDEGLGLSTQWLINNWEEWIYPECDVENVHILDEYVATPID
ncbi:Imm45 family immunity protein [Pantoea sp.]|uniref:Imm45 family immunity protein n=1 Tax=Pantoea sp. TaxID=69393 RepID=UPI0028AFBE62|nr:Imm45 family immunity protein [Pantoea sp.]